MAGACRNRSGRPGQGTGPPSSSSRAAWCRICTSYAARSRSFRSYAARAAGSGRMISSPRVDPGQHRGRDVVGRERRPLHELRRRPRPAPRRRRAGSPSGWSGSTTGRPRCALTPYGESSWPSGLGEGDDAGLDRVVGRHPGRVHQPGERGDVDDPRPSAGA